MIVSFTISNGELSPTGLAFPRRPHPYRLIACRFQWTNNEIGQNAVWLAWRYGMVANVAFITAALIAALTNGDSTFATDVDDASETQPSALIVQRVRIPPLIVTPQMEILVGCAEAIASNPFASFAALIDDSPS